MLGGVGVGERRGRILWLKPLTSEDLSVSFFGSLETPREKRSRKILVDVRRMEKAPRLVTILGIILMSPEDLVVALLYRPSQAPEPELEVAQQAITNLAKQVQVFNDEATALEWLEAGDQPPPEAARPELPEGDLVGLHRESGRLDR